MNANRQRHWMLADPADWAGDGSLVCDAVSRRLTLAQRRPGTRFAADAGPAEAALLRVPHTLDADGVRLWFEAGRLMSLGVAEAAKPRALREGLGAVSDLTLTGDGLLYLAEDGHLRLIDTRSLRPEAVLQAPGFAVWRLAAAPTGGVWALDRTGRRLARASGVPHPPDPVLYAASTARPCVDTPPRLAVLPEPVCADDETPVALACHASGELAVLIWRADGGCALALFDATGGFQRRVALAGVSRAHAVGWFDAGRIACLVAGVREAPVFALDQAGATLDPAGDFYPLRQHDGGPFLNALLPRVHILAGGPAPEARRARPLARLSLPSFLARGAAHNARALDSEHPGQVWHRLYLEATIPDGCGVSVWLAAGESPIPPTAPERWHEHRFGASYTRLPDIPHGVWQTEASELPHHGGLLDCPREPDRTGLFTLLIQRAGQQVRALAGRWLHVRVELSGNGRASPAVAALRAWGERFSYVDHYLPECYRESRVGAEREAAGAASGADFLERSLGNFEGVLTTLEDRIASAHLLTDPRTAPDGALPWLGRWIGLAFDPAWPRARRRALLAAAPELYRSHGTLTGLQGALDVASAGGVTRGEIVVFEDFRFRRVFATILGADLADEHDPLFDGLVASGNSIVGDTLFLGESSLDAASRAELAALFTPDADLADESSVLRFHEQLAWRATVLVRTGPDMPDPDLMRRVAELASPAHVALRVAGASAPLIVGLASLVGIDTRLEPRPGLPVARLDRNAAGAATVARGPLRYTPLAPPVADAGDAQTVGFGTSFVLSGARSRAASGHRIVGYRWQLGT